MYEYIKGQLTKIAPTYIVIEAAGIGYQIQTPNPYRLQDSLNQSLTMFVELVVREDAMILYGFINFFEKQLFLKLNRVSGIGPKSALSILAANDHDGLVTAIETGDSDYLTKFPGVGKKTAQQMVLDLKGQLDFVPEVAEDATNESTTDSSVINEVVEALLGLGYSQREVKRIEKPIKEAGLSTTQEALSLAFKLLLNK
ncbi:Holliday junction branch migration protein RuvA [Fundicoccus culcitae]|uniref:Holliday junction branch migration complex subunit RuvA n=1 Tax=Fundicoccus culcitae TaxID=2969821 RepID=A0ABY5P9M1_9LACT|nr:Holliday junction branch migration protein RuvA [Fundicoccus culcitae]UUX35442.1 Holliday junction branch migration protein RuvA [Fundicoccus culcitae]